jgi:hypothetical protein
VTVNFDDLKTVNVPLSGQYPTGVIDWGTTNAWYVSAPFAAYRSNSVSFNGAGPTSASFTFVVPRILASVDVYNGGGTSSVISIACAGQTTKQQRVDAQQRVTLPTGWTTTCATVTISSSNGWFSNFDNFVVR